MTDVYESLRQRVLGQLAEEQLHPTRDRERTTALVGRVVEEYQRRAHSGLARALADPAGVAARLGRSVLAYGPLSDLLDDPDVEEITIEGADIWFVNRAGRLIHHDEPTNEAELVAVVDRLLMDAGAHVDQSQPMVQAQVLGGRARLGVVVPPVADHLSVTIRQYTKRNETLSQFVQWDSLTPQAALLLQAVAAVKAGVVVAGQPGAGKTSLMNALLRAIPQSHRVLVCEVTRELSADVVGSYYRTRPVAPGGDKSGEITLRDLVQVCLGMRPDVLVVGEVRGEEAFELTRAGNAGCGAMVTVHANSARQALTALVNTALMAGTNVTEQWVRSVFATVFDLVVFLDREDSEVAMEEGRPVRRQVTEISAVSPLQGTEFDFTLEPILVRDELGTPLRWAQAPLPESLRRRVDRYLARRNTTSQQLLGGAG